MKQTPSYPPRRNLRVPEFDYSQPGAYFVTIVTHDRITFFGQIVDGEMVLNEVGKMVERVWIAIPEHFPNVELGEFVIMPNHIHGIISISVEATHASPLPRVSKGPMPGSIGAIIGSFKSAATKRFHEIPHNPETQLWQRNYYERFIRNERDYKAIFEYINSNPMNWDKDEENSTL
jgi:REP element-mobilizing transposase RayT